MHRTQQRLFRLTMGLLLLLVAPVMIRAQEDPSLDALADCGYSALLDEPGLSLGALVLNLENGLESGQGCAENLDQSFHVASVPKVFVAGAVYEALANGTRSPDERITFTEPYWMGGRTDCLSETTIGQNYTPQRLVEFMINCSDNAATWLLMDWLGREQVNAYVESLGISGIGRIIPYAEVDRAKLAFADSRWEDVPAGMASRYYRARMTNGLSTYFGNAVPQMERSQYLELNQQYYDSYRTNTITPRAMGQYFLLLRERALSGDAAAINTLDVMLYTQRLYSVQDIPGTVYIGGKNGFDRGLLAEVSVLYASLLQRIPSGIVIVFGHYTELTPENSRLPNSIDDHLNQLFLQLSPQIRQLLYPNYIDPAVQRSPQLTNVIFQQQRQIESCWGSYFQSGFAEAQVPFLANCLASLPPRISYPVGDNLAMGLVLQQLGQLDTRFVFVYTAPTGRRYSYQEDRSNLNQAAIYWFQPLDLPGQWTVDIYMNLRRIYSETILVQQ